MTRAGVLRLVISFGISVGLLALLLRAVDLDSLRSALSSADWRLLVPAIALYFIGAWLRAVRWGLLLPEHSVTTTHLFQALIVGFTLNNLLPVRMGELARGYWLSRWGKVPYGATFASMVVERVLDGLSLAGLLLVSLLLVPNAPEYVRVAGVVAAGAFCGGAAAVALAVWRADLIARLAERVAGVLPQRVAGMLINLTSSFMRALSLVRGRGRLAKLVALSIVAWCVELGVYYVLMPGFDLPFSYPLALLIGSVGNFATLIPTPGYIGTFEGAVAKVLSDTAGISTTEATAYAIVVHVTLFLPVVILGTVLLWRSHMTFTQLTHSTEPPAQQPAERKLSAAA